MNMKLVSGHVWCFLRKIEVVLYTCTILDDVLVVKREHSSVCYKWKRRMTIMLRRKLVGSEG